MDGLTDRLVVYWCVYGQRAGMTDQHVDGQTGHMADGWTGHMMDGCVNRWTCW